MYYITLTINAMIFLFIYSNNVGGTTVHNEGNAEGILLSPDTFQSNMLNLILKVDKNVSIIYNNDLGFYIQSPPWQGKIKIYQNPIISKTRSHFQSCKSSTLISWSYCAQKQDTSIPSTTYAYEQVE